MSQYIGRRKSDSYDFLTNDKVEELLNQVMEFVRIIQEEDSFPINSFWCPSFTKTGKDRRNVFGRTRTVRFETFTWNDPWHRSLPPSKWREEESDAYPSLNGWQELPYSSIDRKIDSILNKYGKIKNNASTELARIRRIGARWGSISFTEQHTAQYPIRRIYRQGCSSHHARWPSGNPVAPDWNENKRYRTRWVRQRENRLYRTGRSSEANNRIRELEDERREIIRILTEFSNVLRPPSPKYSIVRISCRDRFIRRKATSPYRPTH